jgi:hypothetical protein
MSAGVGPGALGTTAYLQFGYRANCTRCAGSAYRVIFAAQNEGRTLDAMKIREQPHRTSRVPLAAYHRRS